MKKVIDVSVIIKWFAEEEGSDEAFGYLEELKEGKFSILLPQLFIYELGNILLSKKATPQQVGEIMLILHGLYLKITDIGFESFRKVFQNAQELNITFYDASYVTLMQKEDCEFITADKKLYQKISKKFARAKLLGS